MKKRPIKHDCLICKRIKLIKHDKNPYFVAELKTGYVVLGDYQFFKGYTLFLCKEHKSEVHELPHTFRRQHLWEMSQVAEAVYYAFHPQKLNYELLGNTDTHSLAYLSETFKRPSSHADGVEYRKRNS